MYQQKAAKSDSLIALLLIGLLLLSTLIVSSVTIFIAERAYSNPFYFFNRHLVHLALAGICFVVGYLIKPDFWVRYRVLVLMVAISLLVAVLVPGIGSVINGSRRWIRTPLMTIQTSDPAKLAFIMFIAAYASEKSIPIFHSRVNGYQPLVYWVYLTGCCYCSQTLVPQL